MNKNQFYDGARVKVTPEEMNKTIDGWKAEGLTPIQLSTTAPSLKESILWDHYLISNDHTKFYCFDFESGEHMTYLVCGTHVDDEITGKECFIEFQKLLKMLPDSLTLKQMFGVVGKRYWDIMTMCVPSYLNWYNKELSCLPLSDCYKVDVSSAFGYELSKVLPNFNTAVELCSPTDPTEEYPFVFRADGSIAVYEEFDTAVWDKDLYDINHAHEERSKRLYGMLKLPIWGIKCKASNYSLRDVIEYCYDEKESGNKTYKKILNYTVGMMWAKKNPIYIHLAAIVIARCNKRMEALYHEIKSNGGTPLLIATDSIAWVGSSVDCEYDDDKHLGALVMEHEACDMYIAGSKCYQILDYDGVLTTKWSGVAAEDRAKYGFGELPQNPVVEKLYCWGKDKFIIEEVSK